MYVMYVCIFVCVAVVRKNLVVRRNGGGQVRGHVDVGVDDFAFAFAFAVACRCRCRCRCGVETFAFAVGAAASFAFAVAVANAQIIDQGVGGVAGKRKCSPTWEKTPFALAAGAAVSALPPFAVSPATALSVT